MSVVKEGASLASFDYLNESLAGMFKQLVWWADALKAARAKYGLATAQRPILDRP